MRFMYVKYAQSLHKGKHEENNYKQQAQKKECAAFDLIPHRYGAIGREVEE